MTGPELKRPPRYFGSVIYYARAMACGSELAEEWRFDKRDKEAHRCAIADVNGKMLLTVPIVKERDGDTWADVLISGHGGWRDVHRVALESAYGRTPYFEFYIDRFMPVFQKGEFATISQLDAFIDKQVLGIISLPQTPPCEVEPQTIEYYQVRKEQLGFISGLSILDLIFNMGPESGKVIKTMIERGKRIEQW